MKTKSLSKLACLIIAAEVLVSGMSFAFASPKSVDEVKVIDWPAANDATLTTKVRLPKKIIGEAIVIVALFAALKSMTATLATIFFSPSGKAFAAIKTKMGAPTEQTGNPYPPNRSRT